MDAFNNFTKVPLANAGSADLSAWQLTPEQQALASQYTTLASRVDEPDTLVSLNDTLRSKTFIVGNVPSKADFAMFERVYEVAPKWTAASDIAKYRHILRWVDLVQNVLVEVPTKVEINYDVELPREVKEKKKKGEEGKDAKGKDAKGKDSKGKEAKGKNEPKEAKGAKGPQGEISEEEKQRRAEQAKAKKEAKAKAKAEAAAKTAAAAVPPNPGMIDFRVGYIEKAVKHPDADALYVSTIQMGDEEGPRTVCSGLVRYIPLEEMQQRYVVTVANLKPVTMRGIKSCAMVLCASTEDKVEFVNPPEGSKPGDKIFFEGYDAEPEKQLNPKKKIWEAVQPGFSTNEQFEVTYTVEGKPAARLVNKKGELCHNSTIVKADVK
ncbi:tRNA-aminoacylation cofactor Arc1p [Diutina catenulata]